MNNACYLPTNFLVITDRFFGRYLSTNLSTNFSIGNYRQIYRRNMISVGKILLTRVLGTNFLPSIMLI